MAEIPDGHEEWEAKVTYSFGPFMQYLSTAYTDTREVRTDIVHGTNKYTDAPVRLLWSAERGRWEEVDRDG